MHPLLFQFLRLAVAHLLAVASPGPDFAMVLRQSLHRGRRAALWTSVGIGSAILLHVTYSLLGIGLLLRASPVAFGIVKLAGAAYLLWIGVTAVVSGLRERRAVRSGAQEQDALEGATRGPSPESPAVPAVPAVPSVAAVPAAGRAAPRASGEPPTGGRSAAGGEPPLSDGRAWWSGFLTNALNPKATLFFVVLFASVAGPSTPRLVLAGFGLWMAATTAAWFCMVSLVFTRPAARAAFLRCRGAIDLALGAVFILLAGLLAAATV